MTTTRFSYSWPPGSKPAEPAVESAPRSSLASLEERLSEVTLDRAASAEKLVLETGDIVLDWVLEQPDKWDFDVAGRDIEKGLSAWSTEHDWRGPCAVWMDSVRRTFHWAREARAAGGLRGVMAEELSLWLWGREPGLEHLEDFSAHWNGEPLAPGRRMPLRTDLAQRAARTLERGETILVTAFSETVCAAMEAAERAGKKPAMLIGEGQPNLEGRRMARRLSRLGIQVTLCYDNALANNLPRADRIWLSTEAIGVDAFLARVGTTRLLEEAARLSVPALLLATSDKLMPGGHLFLPAWCERDTWILWEDPPEGVRLEPQPYEAVPLDMAGAVVTEVGLESPAALHLRRLRLETSPPCAPWEPAARSASGERELSIST